MADTATRMRRYRARQKAGRMVVRVEIDDTDVPQRLIDAGYLAPERFEDSGAIGCALERFIREFFLVADGASDASRHAFAKAFMVGPQ